MGRQLVLERGRQMKSLPDLKQEWLTNYVAGDGLADGMPGRNKTPGIDGSTYTTVPVDNGILFAVEGYFLWSHHKMLDQSDVFRYRKSLRETQAFADTPGLHHRNPGRATEDNAHDNVAAMICGCALFDNQRRLRELYDWGSAHSYLWLVYTYNNVHPDIIDKKRWIQPSDAFIMHLALGNMPGPLETLWFWLKMWHTSKYQMSRLRSGIHISSALLNWIRLKALDAVKHRPWYLRPYFWLVKRRRDKWIQALLKHTDGIGEVFRIYFPHGPLLQQISKDVRY